jgi:ATP-grasp domain, R2K clade family 3
MKPVILFRKDHTTLSEFEIAKKYFDCVELRSVVPDNSLVIPRYSCLPYYKELALDLKAKGSLLVNSTWDHQYIADFDYYEDVKEYTFESWHERDYPYSGYDGPVVIKGKTNSKKQKWSTQMFAENKKMAIDVASELANDMMIGQQGLIYRKYTPLKTFEICPISRLPLTNEWRCFYYGTKLLTKGYYWNIASDESIAKAQWTEEAQTLADTVAKIISEHANFFVLDVAEKQEGGWVLVEVNDASMSGLSMNSPDDLYSKLAQVIAEEGRTV